MNTRWKGKYSDSKLAAIGGGTSDIMRMIVSRIMMM